MSGFFGGGFPKGGAKVMDGGFSFGKDTKARPASHGPSGGKMPSNEAARPAARGPSGGKKPSNMPARPAGRGK